MFFFIKGSVAHIENFMSECQSGSDLSKVSNITEINDLPKASNTFKIIGLFKVSTFSRKLSNFLAKNGAFETS